MSWFSFVKCPNQRILRNSEGSVAGYLLRSVTRWTQRSTGIDEIVANRPFSPRENAISLPGRTIVVDRALARRLRDNRMWRRRLRAGFGMLTGMSRAAKDRAATEAKRKQSEK
jgi:hypothetical protein